MHIKTILNRIEKQPGFIYDTCRWRDSEPPALVITLRPQAGSKPICSKCGERRPGYDTLRVRSFVFVPLWAIPVFFLYAPRRVQCPTCGVKVERLPWAVGKSHLTISYAWFLAAWCKRLSWKEVTWSNKSRRFAKPLFSEAAVFQIPWGSCTPERNDVACCCKTSRCNRRYPAGQQIG